VSLAVSVVLSCCSSVIAETWRLKDGEQWESVGSDPQEQFRHAVSELRELARSGDEDEVKEALRQVKEEFPDRVGPDLESFILGEMHYWMDHYGRAVARFEKMFKYYETNFRRSSSWEFSPPALQREFDIATAYLNGHPKIVLGFIPISGYAEGISIMEKISNRAGLDEPNGIGLRAAIAVAEYYEAKEKYSEAYLKWAEIATYWETGPIGKRALYRMAEDNLASYDHPPEQKRSNFDASRLTTAKTYYAKFQALYPADAKENEVPEKLRHIEEEMAYKQLTVAQFYYRTGKRRAAHLYFDMVASKWPGTEAGALAKEALEGKQEGGK
jgi:hypothetical protein